MKYLLRIILIVQFCFVSGSVVDPNSGWSYVQSTGQAFYMILDSDLIAFSDGMGNPIEVNGDGSNTQTGEPDSDCFLDPSNCDALGAFKNHDISQSECSDLNGVYLGEDGCDVCVGWVYYNSYSGEPTVVTTLLLNGNDNSGGEYDYYLNNGDTPKLKLYDASESTTYSLAYNLSLAGSTIEEYAINEIYVYYANCSEVALPMCEEEISPSCCVDISFGATCQFDFDSDDICDEIDDCVGIIDECGECNGDGVDEGACDCQGNTEDECGECGGDSSTCTGCMDTEACNFDESATISGECEYPSEGEDCDGNDLDNQIQLPGSFDIVSIYPNPFNPSTHIKYSLDVGQSISIRVLNSNGNVVKSLFSGPKLAGYHNFIWAPEPSISSGQYFIQISTQDNSLIKKVTFIK